MADRPAQLCELQKDKFIGGQVGFVDTFNWAVRAIDNLKGGKNCNIDWTVPDRPVINVDVSEEEEEQGIEISAVYDVISADGSNGISVEYVDDRETKFIPFSPDVSAVYDVFSDVSGDLSGITVKYVDSRSDEFIPFTGGGEVQFTGTNGIDGSLSSAFAF